MSEKKEWIHLEMIAGYVAMYGVRQSPYHNPDNLGVVVGKFQVAARGRFDPNRMALLDRDEVNGLLKDFLYPIPEFAAWNERKNGNKAPFGFSSLYDHPVPDNDFIDLDALVMNVVHSLFVELQHDS